MRLQGVPRVSVESLAHLWRHVGQVEGFVAVLLVQSMVASRGHVPAIIAGSPVVCVLGPEERVDALVLFKITFSSIHGIVLGHRLRRQVLEHPGDSDMKSHNVVESLHSKKQQILLSTQLVKMILKIDDVRSKNEGGM